MARNFYSNVEAALAAGAMNLVAVVSPAPQDFGLNASQIAGYEALAVRFRDLWRETVDPSTRTPVTVAGKRQTKRLLKSATVKLARIAAATPSVSDAQLVAIGLNPRPVRRRKSAPALAPVVWVIDVVGRVVRVRVKDAAMPTSRARAEGAIGAEISVHVGDEPATDARQYRLAGFATRATHSFTLPDSVPSGAKVWICARWVTGRGETSVTSAPVTVCIQGGCVRPAA